AYMLSDAKVSVLLTQDALRAQLPHHDTRIVLLDAHWSEIERYPDTPPPNTARPANLAYVIYTSGSTGKPKGITMPHGALVNLLTWHMASGGNPAESS